MLVTRIINLIFGIIEFMLGVRILFELLGASSGAPFIAWVYAVTWPFVAPFSGAFSNIQLSGISVLDTGAILAMIVYAIVGWAAGQLCLVLFAGA